LVRHALNVRLLTGTRRQNTAVVYTASLMMLFPSILGIHRFLLVLSAIAREGAGGRRASVWAWRTHGRTDGGVSVPAPVREAGLLLATDALSRVMLSPVHLKAPSRDAGGYLWIASVIDLKGSAGRLAILTATTRALAMAE
jgi:hypothetical protein